MKNRHTLLNVTVEFKTLEHKMRVLSRKRQLRFTSKCTVVLMFAKQIHLMNYIYMEKNFSKFLQSLPCHDLTEL